MPVIVTGRGEKIRTSDPLLPKQVRYQAALRPDVTFFLALLGIFVKCEDME